MAGEQQQSSESTLEEKLKDVKLEENKKKMMKFKLETNDKTIFEVDEDVAFQSNLIKKIVTDFKITDADDPRLNDPLPLQSVNGEILKKLLDWCTDHRGEPIFVEKEPLEDQRIPLTEYDNKYMNVKNDKLVEILLGANFMDIPGIIEIITQKIALMTIDKSVEEMRVLFCLKNDFTPEEEEEMRERYEWLDVE